MILLEQTKVLQILDAKLKQIALNDDCDLIDCILDLKISIIKLPNEDLAYQSISKHSWDLEEIERIRLEIDNDMKDLDKYLTEQDVFIDNKEWKNIKNR